MSQSPLTVDAFAAQMRKRLTDAGIADPLTDTRLLMGEVVGFSLTDFVLNGTRLVSDEETAEIEAMIARREHGEPVHRILGHREFYGLDLVLSQGTLEPRPDTEVLVDALLPHVKRIIANTGTARILDMGTGTGAICLALLHECPEATGVGSDISPDALETARKNANRHGLDARFEAVESHWFEQISGRFDIIVSNPPYIKTQVIETLDRDVRNFDPMLALDGGEDGLSPYRSIAEKAVDFLSEDGVIGVEIGYDQKVDVTAIFASNAYGCIEAIRDYGGNDRALIFCK
ncbi:MULTISPECIES: peptide chain release factor N(5)-glutamine methyltransferase [Agrobacterium]|uniref:peptide chain release factor N(5)-glutamine methyltransferase n=1 Tax=Agrobacterium TaxID=357 RepID=UPI0009725544|nr:peptide chain release factor N(5)-glutamine methyltransferase [Agrobacterium sp. DSM 25558]SCX08893.1 Release factor glutamine methyltransferase [Agrobacterium sp. DSM 25558]